MSQSRLARELGGVLVVVVALVSACAPDPGGDRSTPTGSSSEPTQDAVTEDVEAVMDRYGIQLPDDATEPEVTARPDDIMSDQYLVTFRAPAVAAGDMCIDAEINGPLVAVDLTADESDLFGVDVLPDDARSCRGSSKVDRRRQIRVLFDGDPATVRVALYTMPER